MNIKNISSWILQHRRSGSTRCSLTCSSWIQPIVRTSESIWRKGCNSCLVPICPSSVGRITSIPKVIQKLHHLQRAVASAFWTWWDKLVRSVRVSILSTVVCQYRPKVDAGRIAIRKLRRWHIRLCMQYSSLTYLKACPGFVCKYHNISDNSDHYQYFR